MSDDKSKVDSIMKKVDFSEEERALGRTLTEREKRVAILDFNEFISILRTEHGKKLGCHVYIKREDPPSPKPKRRKKNSDPTQR
jgi:hypothetical protein